MFNFEIKQILFFKIMPWEWLGRLSMSNTWYSVWVRTSANHASNESWRKIDFQNWKNWKSRKAAIWVSGRSTVSLRCAQTFVQSVTWNTGLEYQMRWESKKVRNLLWCSLIKLKMTRTTWISQSTNNIKRWLGMLLYPSNLHIESHF